jgi:HPt (histidine-containing phosphotransfer) domain-containing protein
MDDEVFGKLKKLGFDEKATLPRFVDDRSFYLSCLSSFISETDLSGLKAALEHSDSQQAFQHLHALKGVTGNLGLGNMYDDVCASVEKLRSGSLDGWKGDFDRIEADFAKIKALEQ